MKFEDASTLEAVGGENDPARPTVQIDGTEPMTSRDSQTDARTIADVAGMSDESASDDLDRSGWQVDVGVESIAQEIRDQGWDKLAEPVGAEPKPISTSGGRGADDIGKL